MRSALSTPSLGCFCILGLFVASDATAQLGAVEGVKVGLRARMIAAGAVAQVAVRECDYDKWVLAHRERDNAWTSWLEYRQSLTPQPPLELFDTGAPPPFPTYPFPCSPQTAAVQTPRTALRTAAATRNVSFQIGAGVSTLEGIKVANGGLGGEQSITSPSVEFVMSSPHGMWGTVDPGGSSFEARFFARSGESERHVSGTGNTALQPNGGTQVIQGAGQVSEGRSNAEMFRLVGEVKANLPRIGSGGLSFVPFLGVGFEYSKLQTNLFARWAPIAFTIEDIRKVETNRVYVFAGAQHDVAQLSGVDLFVRWLVQMNADSVTANGVYRTMQFNNFDETDTGSASKTSVTFGARIAFGAATTLANGTTFEFNTFVGTVPVWQLEYHNGQPATLSQDHNLNYGVQGVIRIPVPITGPRPFDIEALRNITFR